MKQDASLGGRHQGWTPWWDVGDIFDELKCIFYSIIYSIIYSINIYI